MLSAITDVRFESVALNAIGIDPLLTPKALEVPKHLEGDRSMRFRYYSLAAEFDYIEPLKLGLIAGEVRPLLLSNFEAYQAIQERFHENPSALVPAVIYRFANAVSRKALSTQLAALERSPQPYLARLYELVQYQEMNLSVQDIRRIYGIHRSASAEGKQLRRDLALVRHKRLLGHLLGIDFRSFPPGSQLLLPNLGRATLSYGLTLAQLKILGPDPSAIDQFLDHFEGYISELRRSHASPEDETKPVYQWASFNKSRVEGIAHAVAAARGIPATNREEENDVRWELKFDERSGTYSVPQIHFNVHGLDAANVKKMVEIAYKSQMLSETLNGHLRRIRPVQHGASLKVGESSVEARIPIPSNIPKFEDGKYVEAIRRDKTLKYSNRSMLLKCLHLWPGIFRFDSSAPDAVSTRLEAFSGYEKWYRTSFLEDVFRYHQNSEKNHPFYRTYVAIRVFLAKYSDDPTSIFFSEFIEELFSYVFVTLDRDEENSRARAEDVARLEGKLKAVLWPEIEKKLRTNGKVSLTKDELESLIRERIHRHEKDVAQAVSDQNRIISRIVEDPFLLKSRSEK